MQSIEYVVTESLVTAVLVVASVELVSFIVRRAARAAGAWKVSIRDLGTFARIVELVLIAFAVAQITGLTSVFTTLTISGIAAVAFSLALQTTLSNVISGILLLSDGVIHLGDSIEYGGVKGKVVRIALRNTWIELDDGSISVVSNTSLSNGPLVNRSAADRLKRKYALD
ncbi:MAG: mechanosensitive ion channel domain-containing protein [Nitrososphaerales archaeon]|jgi:small-conductance mechanosensitive channel